MLFPTRTSAQRCLEFVQERAPKDVLSDLVLVNLVLDPTKKTLDLLQSIRPAISAVLCKADAFPVAKQYWQHSGDGVSSRRAEFCHGLFRDGLLVLEKVAQSPPQSYQKMGRGPRRYQRHASVDETNGTAPPPPSNSKNGTSDEAAETLESTRFLEERFGRNLDVSLVENAKSAIKRRMVGALAGEVDLNNASFPSMHLNARGISNLKEDDIYLFPCGMNAIFIAHQTLLRTRGPWKSIEFGFPYVDTLKILQKFGPGCVFYGHASAAELDDLEARLKNGDKFLGLYCEFPGNPLLTCPDLVRIRQLADTYDFAVVIDETIGSFINTNVLPFADIVVSSLTKIFSGDCNVMGGGLVLNPNSRYYSSLKGALGGEFEDNYWAEDVMFMERNSRDFVSRIDRVNVNSEAICEVLLAHPNVTNVYYPKHVDTRPNYEACRTPNGGYGGLISCTLKNKEQAIAFFDALDTAKGPSLGTNFTLTSPYVLLAHYQELDWAQSLGVNPDLLRFSVGLEDTEVLKSVFTKALKATEELPTGSS
jgi:cystathionine gamma-synthase